MSNTTVSKLAIALKISSEKLISQLNEAGVNVGKEVDEITNDQKMALLNHLRGSHGTKKEIKSPSKLTVNRRSQSELKLSGGFGTARTVNVEVRKKKTYLSKESLIEEAELENIKQQQEEEQLKEKIAKESQDNISNETVETTEEKVETKTAPIIDLSIQDQPTKTSKKKKKKSRPTIKDDPFKMEKLHVKGNFKRKKKRQIRRSVNPASLDQSHSFELHLMHVF